MENFEMEWNSFGISLDGVLVKLDEGQVLGRV